MFLLLACTETSKESENAFLFTDITKEVELNFEHHSGATGKFLFPEIVGAGGAMLDFDNDGDMDILMIQSGNLESPSSVTNSNRLFRNELVPQGKLVFTDVSQSSGIVDSAYGMGVACGDFDNDGHVDVYITNFGSNTFYRNLGNGAFEDVTELTGTDDQRWSTSAAFIDVDHDGDLDLYVTNYAAYSISENKACKNPAGRADYCAPATYEGTTDSLFKNNGDGTFIDVSEVAGITTKSGPGLGVLGADFDGNGRVDIFVANDLAANFMWQNQGDGSFTDDGLMSGVAYNADGKAEASMGVTAGDFDGDGDDDLFMTHLTNETNTLYMNNGSGEFVDVTSTSGLGQESLSQTGFGSSWIDFDNDGDLDLFIANGAVGILNERVDISDYPYEQANQVFENTGNKRFTDVSQAAGLDDMSIAVSRGAAFGDIDNDGDIDILVANNNGPAKLLRNNKGHLLASVAVTLVGITSNRDAQGARVALNNSSGQSVWRRVHIDGSFASSNDPRVHFGLNKTFADAKTDQYTVEVIWPSGIHETWHQPTYQSHIELTEGTGQLVTH